MLKSCGVLYFVFVMKTCYSEIGESYENAAQVNKLDIHQQRHVFFFQAT